MTVMKIKAIKGPGSGTLGASIVYDEIGYPRWSSDVSSALLVPAGDTTTRPSNPITGMVRYNSQTSQFEGYGPGSAWGSLGGVVDVDQDTKITAESHAGANENTLSFYTGVDNGNGYTSVLQSEIGNTYIKIPSGTTTSRDALTAANGMMRYNSDLKRFEVRQNGSWTRVLTSSMSYSGQAGQVARVNSTGTDLEFFTFPSAILRLPFRVNFLNLNPSSISEIPTTPIVPQTWDITISGADLIINHYMGKVPLFVFANGWNTGITPNAYIVRATTASGLQISFRNDNLNQCRLIGVTSTNCGGSPSEHAYVNLYFMN